MLAGWHITRHSHRNTDTFGRQPSRPATPTVSLSFLLPELSWSLVCSGFINMLILLLGCAAPRSPGLWLISAVAAEKKAIAFWCH